MFRFETLESWKMSVEVAGTIFDLADGLEDKKLFHFAEQLREAALSISNNIAAGAGSVSRREFVRFLNLARRSTFENANMLIIFTRKGLISKESSNELLERLDLLARKLTSFQRTLHLDEKLYALCSTP